MQLYRQDTYTGAATGFSVDMGGWAISKFAIQVKSAGGIASLWNVVLEGSLDGTNYMTLLTHTQALGDGNITWTASDSPCLYLRSRVTSLTLGLATNVTVTILGI